MTRTRPLPNPSPPYTLAVLHVLLSTVSLRLALHSAEHLSPSSLEWSAPLRGVATLALSAIVGVVRHGMTIARSRRAMGQSQVGGGGMTSSGGQGHATEGPKKGWSILLVGLAMLCSSGPLVGWVDRGRWTWIDPGLIYTADLLIAPSLLLLLPFFPRLPPPSSRTRSLILFLALTLGLLLLPLPTLTRPSLLFLLLSIPLSSLLLIQLKRIATFHPPGGILLALFFSHALATTASLLTLLISSIVRARSTAAAITQPDAAAAAAAAATAAAAVDLYGFTDLPGSKIRQLLRVLSSSASASSQQSSSSFNLSWALISGLDELVFALLIERAQSPSRVALLALPRAALSLLWGAGPRNAVTVGPGRFELLVAVGMVSVAAFAGDGGKARDLVMDLWMRIKLRGKGKEVERELPTSLRTSGLGTGEKDSTEIEDALSSTAEEEDLESSSSGSGTLINSRHGHGHGRRRSDQSMPSLGSRQSRLLTCLLPLSLFLIRQLIGLTPDPPVQLRSLASLRALLSPGMTGHGSVDVVISYYDEGLDVLKGTAEMMRTHEVIGARKPRFVVYVKNEGVRLGDVADSIGLTGADEIVRLENHGREGGTYLSHILRYYNASIPLESPSLPYTHSPEQPHSHHKFVRRQDVSDDSSSLEPAPAMSEPDSESEKTPQVDTRPLPERAIDGLMILRPPSHHPPRQGRGFADHTLFLQGHLAWSGVSERRLGFLTDEPRRRTGYLSFGPYIENDCGKDLAGNGEFERLKDIYTIFAERFCGPEHQLTSYAAQHVVSRRRILASPYSKYANLEATLNAPSSHWIHQEGTWWHYHGIPGPTNPYLGHALERSWPIIFGCSDVKIARECGNDEENKDVCQCWDP